MTADESIPYAIDAEDSNRVVDGAGRTVVQCQDAMSAQHYVELLTRAYRSGYRAGYREARAESTAQ